MSADVVCDLIDVRWIELTEYTGHPAERHGWMQNRGHLSARIVHSPVGCHIKPPEASSGRQRCAPSACVTSESKREQKRVYEQPQESKPFAHELRALRPNRFLLGAGPSRGTVETPLD